ncbi:hypothetical protein ADIMK_3917 [Marinobacterium lacunae]|uniref:Uncharacterized protein n=1 Tax=Marinobacterium lacunae TaxID=1232683 RepID=A0A081FTB5_9GAMM|nr:hypothetical protein ADIMK_3917 [Marinobacterium lacunae]
MGTEAYLAGDIGILKSTQYSVVQCKQLLSMGLKLLAGDREPYAILASLQQRRSYQTFQSVHLHADG